MLQRVTSLKLIYVSDPFTASVIRTKKLVKKGAGRTRHANLARPVVVVRKQSKGANRRIWGGALGDETIEVDAEM